MKKLMLFFLALSVSGCVSTQSVPLDVSHKASMTGKSLTVIQRESPSFMAMSYGKGMFALAGVGAAVAEGNTLVKEKNIEDPSLAIASSLAKSYAGDYGLMIKGYSSESVDSSDVSVITQAADGSDYALDVVTHAWGYMYDGISFSDHYVTYRANLRLIDTASKNVISSGACVYEPKKAGKAPMTQEEMQANNAAKIKAELAAATKHCVQHFKAELL